MAGTGWCTNKQLDELKVWFDLNATPSRRQVDTISDHLGLKSAVVWIWFHRQRVRVQQRRDVLAKQKSLNKQAKLKDDVGRTSGPASKPKGTDKKDGLISMQRQSHRHAGKELRDKVPASGRFPKMGGANERQSSMRSRVSDICKRDSSHEPSKMICDKTKMYKGSHKPYPVLTTEPRRSHYLLAPNQTKSEKCREKRNLSSAERVVKSRGKEHKPSIPSTSNQVSKIPNPKSTKSAVTHSSITQRQKFGPTSKAINLRNETDGKDDSKTDYPGSKRTTQMSQTSSGKSHHGHSVNKNPSVDRSGQSNSRSVDIKVHHRSAEKNLRSLKRPNVSAEQRDVIMKEKSTIRNEKLSKCVLAPTSGKNSETVKHVDIDKSKMDRNNGNPLLSQRKFIELHVSSKNKASCKVDNPPEVSCPSTLQENVKRYSKRKSTVREDSQRSIFSSLSFPAKVNSQSESPEPQHSRISKRSVQVIETASARVSGKSIPVISRPRHPEVPGNQNKICDRNLRKIPLTPPEKAKKRYATSDIHQSSKITSTVTGNDSSSSEMYYDELVDSESADEDQPIKVSTSTSSLSDASSVEDNNVKQNKAHGRENGQTNSLISKEKCRNLFKDKCLFKKELTLKLIKVNISSALESRKVTMSGKASSDTISPVESNDNVYENKNSISKGLPDRESLSTTPSSSPNRSLWNVNSVSKVPSKKECLSRTPSPSPNRSLWNLVSSLSKKIEDDSIMENSSDTAEVYSVTSQESVEDINVADNCNIENELCVCEVSSSGFTEKTVPEESRMATHLEESKLESEPMKIAEDSSGSEKKDQSQELDENDVSTELHFEEEVLSESFLVIDEVVCSDVDTNSPQPDSSQDTLPYGEPMCIQDSVDDRFDEISDDEDETACSQKCEEGESFTKILDVTVDCTIKGGVEHERMETHQAGSLEDVSLYMECESVVAETRMSHQVKNTVNEADDSGDSQGQVSSSAGTEDTVKNDSMHSVNQSDSEASLIQLESPAKDSSECVQQSFVVEDTGCETEQVSHADAEELELSTSCAKVDSPALTNSGNEIVEKSVAVYFECDTHEIELSANNNDKEDILPSEQCFKGRENLSPRKAIDSTAANMPNIPSPCDYSSEVIENPPYNGEIHAESQVVIADSSPENYGSNNAAVPERSDLNKNDVHEKANAISNTTAELERPSTEDMEVEDKTGLIIHSLPYGESNEISVSSKESAESSNVVKEIASVCNTAGKSSNAEDVSKVDSTDHSVQSDHISDIMDASVSAAKSKCEENTASMNDEKKISGRCSVVDSTSVEDLEEDSTGKELHFDVKTKSSDQHNCEGNVPSSHAETVCDRSRTNTVERSSPGENVEAEDTSKKLDLETKSGTTDTSINLDVSKLKDTALTNSETEVIVVSSAITSGESLVIENQTKANTTELQSKDPYTKTKMLALLGLAFTECKETAALSNTECTKASHNNSTLISETDEAADHVEDKDISSQMLQSKTPIDSACKATSPVQIRLKETDPSSDPNNNLHLESAPLTHKTDANDKLPENDIVSSSNNKDVLDVNGSKSSVGSDPSDSFQESATQNVVTCQSSAALADTITITGSTIDAASKVLQLKQNSEENPETNKTFQTQSTAEESTCGEHQSSCQKQAGKKRRRDLTELVSRLKMSMGDVAVCDSGAEKSPTNSLHLKNSHVGINRNTQYSPKCTESSHQLPKSICRTDIPKGRVIKNKNVKRPPIPQSVLQSIEAQNPMPFDRDWKKMATLVSNVLKQSTTVNTTVPVTVTGAVQTSVEIPRSNPEASPPALSSNTPPRALMETTRPCSDGSRTPPSSSTQPTADGSSVPHVVSPLLMNLLTKSPRPPGFDPGSLTTPAPVGTKTAAEKPQKRRRRSRTGQKGNKKRKTLDDLEGNYTPADMAAVSTSIVNEYDIQQEWMDLLKLIERPSSEGGTPAESSQPTSSSPSIDDRPAPPSYGDHMTTRRMSEPCQSDSTTGDDSMPSIVRVYSLRDEGAASSGSSQPGTDVAQEGSGSSGAGFVSPVTNTRQRNQSGEGPTVHWHPSTADMNSSQASPQSTLISSGPIMSQQHVLPSMPSQDTPSRLPGRGHYAISSLQVLNSNQLFVPPQQNLALNSTPVMGQVNPRNVATPSVVHGMSFPPGFQPYRNMNQALRPRHVLPANDINTTYMLAPGSSLNGSPHTQPVLLKRVGTAFVPLPPNGVENGQLPLNSPTANTFQRIVSQYAETVEGLTSINLPEATPCQMNRINPYTGIVSGPTTTNLPPANSCQSTIIAPYPGAVHGQVSATLPGSNQCLSSSITDSPPLCTPYPSPLPAPIGPPSTSQRNSSTSAVQSSQSFQSSANACTIGIPVPATVTTGTLVPTTDTINNNYMNQSFGFTHYNQKSLDQSNAATNSQR